MVITITVPNDINLTNFLTECRKQYEKMQGGTTFRTMHDKEKVRFRKALDKLLEDDPDLKYGYSRIYYLCCGNKNSRIGWIGAHMVKLAAVRLREKNITSLSMDKQDEAVRLIGRMYDAVLIALKDEDNSYQNFFTAGENNKTASVLLSEGVSILEDAPAFIRRKTKGYFSDTEEHEGFVSQVSAIARLLFPPVWLDSTVLDAPHTKRRYGVRKYGYSGRYFWLERNLQHLVDELYKAYATGGD